MNVVAILLKILSVALWIIQAGYSATQGRLSIIPTTCVSGSSSTLLKGDITRKNVSQKEYIL